MSNTIIIVVIAVIMVVDAVIVESIKRHPRQCHPEENSKISCLKFPFYWLKTDLFENNPIEQMEKFFFSSKPHL